MNKKPQQVVVSGRADHNRLWSAGDHPQAWPPKEMKSRSLHSRAGGSSHPEAPAHPRGVALLFSGRGCAARIPLPALNVDTTKTTHISLCSGYGGIDLGLRRVIPSLRTIAYSEIETFACELLLSRMEGGQLDPAPIWSDLKCFPWADFSGLVDILTGGYPCQPFSSAGKRLGAEDPRHLWPHIASGIRLLRPRICFFENVEGHITLGLREVIGELEKLGYTTAWGIFSAAEVGAPHQRRRVFILAVSSSIGGATGLSGSLTGNEGQPGVANDSSNQAWPSRPGEPQHAWEPPRVVGNNSDRRECDVPRDAPQQDSDRQNNGISSETNSMGTTTGLDGAGQTGGQRETQAWRAGAEWDNRQTQPALGGNADGPASGLDYAELCESCDNRTDELRLLGNGVVPATAENAFRTLLKQLWT